MDAAITEGKIMCETTKLLATLIDIMTNVVNTPGDSIVFRTCNRIAHEHLTIHEYNRWYNCPVVITFRQTMQDY